MTESKLIEAEFACDIVPGPVEYAVLLPKEYEVGSEFPLLYFLQALVHESTNFHNSATLPFI